MPDPHFSTILKDYITAGGIIAGGLWALWKWGFSEVLRKTREIPSLDGRIDAVTIRISEDKAIVSVEALWRNRGPIPVKVDTETTYMEVGKLGQNMELGSLRAQLGRVNLLYKTHPLKDLVGYTLEPNTESILQEHFVLEKKGAYFIRCGLYRRKNWWSKGEYYWEKEFLWRCND